MGLFSKRKTEYQGFARYADEINRYSQNTPAQSNARAQSLTSASQAALAALQKHQKAPTSGAAQALVRTRPQSYQKGVPGGYRANSLGGYGQPQRANSMQSYTYQYEPKASYATGPVSAARKSPSLPQNHGIGPQKPSAPRLHSLQGPRTQSLRLNSLAGLVRLGRRLYQAVPVFAEEDEDRFTGFEDGYYAPALENNYIQDIDEYGQEDGEGDVVVTTKTTKVVDAAGRTRLITMETIRQLPDGTNVIETKTTNISRTGSRAGSRANSLQSGPSYGPGHVASNGAAYNLKKIEEDLQDFDYTYLDEAPPKIHDGMPQQPPKVAQSQKVAQSPKTAVEAPAPFTPPAQKDHRANSLSSAQSPKKLKSILKSSTSAANAAAAVAASALHNPAPNGSSEKAVQETTPSQNGDASFSPKVNRAPRASPPKLQPAPELGYSGSNRLSSLTSNGTSIKFRDTVETIPYTYPAETRQSFQELAHDEEYKKKQAVQESVDLYSKALQVAAEKVYGTPKVGGAAFDAAPESPQSKDIQKLSAKKLKTDEKISKTEAEGVSRNYVYTNHHKDFSIRSLRDGDGSTRMSRKDRAKEEKRQAKEEEKRHAEWLKAAEKLLKEDEKKQAEDAKVEEKSRKHEEKEIKKKEKSGFSLFKRNKRKGSVGESVSDSMEARLSMAISEEARIPQAISEEVKIPQAIYEEARIPQASAVEAKPPLANSVAVTSPLPKDTVAHENHQIPAPNAQTTKKSSFERQRFPAAASVPVAFGTFGASGNSGNSGTSGTSGTSGFSKSSEGPSHLVNGQARETKPIPQTLQNQYNSAASQLLPELRLKDLDSLQPLKSQTFNDLSEEFVDVPDDLEREQIVRPSGANLLHAKDQEVSNKDISKTVSDAEAPAPVALADSNSSQSTKIPEQGDLLEPFQTKQQQKNALNSTPHYAESSTEHPQQGLLPTLVSGANGKPQVVTSNDHHVFQPRDLNNLDDLSVRDTLDAAFEDASDSFHGSVEEDKPVVQKPDQKAWDHVMEDNRESTPPTAIFGLAPRSPIMGSPKKRGHRREISVDQISRPFEAHKIPLPALFGSEFQSGAPVIQENDVRVPTDQRIPDVDTKADAEKSKPTKKTGRFKRAIEKYFLNSYPREQGKV